MTYSLKLWTNPSRGDDVRLYINGTTRQSVFFCLRNGHIVWSSKANDTPAKFRTGDHWGKVRKDGDAARVVAEAFGIPLGDASRDADWARAVEIAKAGIEVEA